MGEDQRLPLGSVVKDRLFAGSRLRVGDWRTIYQIIDDQLLILVLEIGSRGDIYR